MGLLDLIWCTDFSHLEASSRWTLGASETRGREKRHRAGERFDTHFRDGDGELRAWQASVINARVRVVRPKVEIL